MGPVYGVLGHSATAGSLVAGGARRACRACQFRPIEGLLWRGKADQILFGPFVGNGVNFYTGEKWVVPMGASAGWVNQRPSGAASCNLLIWQQRICACELQPGEPRASL